MQRPRHREPCIGRLANIARYSAIDNTLDGFYNTTDQNSRRKEQVINKELVGIHYVFMTKNPQRIFQALPVYLDAISLQVVLAYMYSSKNRGPKYVLDRIPGVGYGGICSNGMGCE